MTISSLLARTCKDVCVYWASPVPDGFGGYTFAEGVELSCRWEEMSQIVSDNQGNQITSRAVVYVLQDVDEEGMLYHGTLDDLDSDPDPKTVDGAYVIKRFQKSPALGSTTDFTRKVFLTPSLSFGGM